MADHRESDLFAYILGVLVLAISGVAVGIASAKRDGVSGTDDPSSATATLQAAAAPDKT